MKKTVRININGLIFNLDEDAYQKLQKYLNSIHRKFKNTIDADELISDVEARIAELFQERVSNRKEVINLNDIESIIKIMGKPDDYGEFIEEEKSKSYTQQKSSKQKSTKRFYRDVDNKVVSGVSAGLAAYFGIDVVIVRILFVVLSLIFGATLLIYILLWIIIPEATTTTQKLEMRGEKVNLDNIEKIIKDGYQEVRTGFSKWQNSPAYDRFRQNVSEILRFAGKIGMIALKVLLIVFGIWLFISAFGLIGSFTSIWFFNDTFLSPMTWNNMNFSMQDFINLFTDSFTATVGMIALYLLIIIPALALIFVSLKLLFRFKAKSRTPVIIATAVWFVSLMIFIGAIGRTAYNFRTSAEKKSVYELYGQYDTLFVAVKPVNIFSSGNKESINRVVVDFENNLDLSGKIRLNFIPDRGQNFELKIEKSAKGSTNIIAAKYVKQIKYDWQQDDSLLVLNRYFDILGTKKVRDQEVNLDLKVPVGKVLYIGKGMDNISYDINWGEDEQYYLMTEDGLEVLDKVFKNEKIKDNSKDKNVKLIQKTDLQESAPNQEEEEIKEMMEELDTL